MKRLFDIAVSFAALVCLAPVFAVLMALIKLEDGGPLFYRGVRVGRFGKHFRIFKFRSMVPEADKLGPSSTAEDDPRITHIGRFLRKYKLDELLQLLNVLMGAMSFVGPRPQVPWAVDLYTSEERALLSVRPGITDYASICFRNEADILSGSTDPDRDYLEKIAPEKIRLGLEYVNNRTFWLDIKIILATVVATAGGNPEALLRALAVPARSILSQD